MPAALRLAPPLRRLAALGLFLALAIPLAASADPPSRAARLSYAAADASFAPAGSDRWVLARINRPLWIGDRVWSANGFVELQIGGASLRLAPRTLLTVLDFDDRLAQFEVTQGSVALHVRAIDTATQAIELDTPSLAFVARTEGDYRVDVDVDRTAVGVRRGWAEVWGAGRAFRLDRREQFVFYDAGLTDYEVYAMPAADAFERWARERARREDRAHSARYVAPGLVGYVDLDDHGEWRTEAGLGNVWYPRVGGQWAPYRYGHWSWIDPWGWTWIDDAAWGFAPFHYGRWTQLRGRWGWVPGPRDVRPVYAPALVAWVDGGRFPLPGASAGAHGVAWFPLAPGEIWRPAYDVSLDYFARVNVSNTFVERTTVVTVYDDVRRGGPLRGDYRYRGAPAAVTVVPVQSFVESLPVQRHRVRVDARAIASVPVAAAPAARPVLQSFVGPAPQARARPPAEATRRTVVAREAPPRAVPALEKRVELVRERGRPLDRETLERPRAAAPAARAPAEAGSRAAAGELRDHVRVVGAQGAAPADLPAAPPAGIARTPRGPVVDVPGAAAQPGDAAARARAERDRSAAPSRPAAGREGGPPRADGDAPAVARDRAGDARAPAPERTREPSRPEAPREARPPVPPGQGAAERTMRPGPAPEPSQPQRTREPSRPEAPREARPPAPPGQGAAERTMRPGPAPEPPQRARPPGPPGEPAPQAPGRPPAAEPDDPRAKAPPQARPERPAQAAAERAREPDAPHPSSRAGASQEAEPSGGQGRSGKERDRDDDGKPRGKPER